MPEQQVAKPEIALAEIDRVRAAGVRFGCILADTGYGLSAPFRQGLHFEGRSWTDLHRHALMTMIAYFL